MCKHTIEIRLTEIASKLDPRDFSGFAEACAEISDPLGVVVGMHADSASGESPDVDEWVKHTIDEFRAVDGMTKEQARDWWMQRYAQQW